MKKSITIAITLIGIAAASIVLFFAFQKNKIIINKNTNVAATFISYTNSDGSVSFQYPSRLNVNQITSTDTAFSDGTGYWYIDLRRESGVTSLEEWANFNKEGWTKISETTLGGQKAFKFVDVGEGAGSQFALVTMINGSTASLFYRYLSEIELNQLLSSIHFNSI